MTLSQLAKRMILTILILSLVFILGSALYYRSLDFLPFLFGVCLGSGVSVIKVLLLEHTVNKALTLEKKKAGTYTGFQHILRLLLSGVVLFLGAVVPQISLWGVFAGILAFQLAVYGVKFTSKS